MTGGRIASVVACAVLLLAGPAQAGAIDDAKAGEAAHDRGAYREAVQLLTRALNSHGLSVKEEEHYYTMRGLAYSRLDQADPAIADFSHVIDLDSGASWAYVDRAIAYRQKRDYKRALAEFDTAVKRFPNYPQAPRGRGALDYYLGRYQEATRDLAAAVQLSPGYAYAVLWLHLAEAKLGRADAQEFESNAGRVNLNAWPGPVLQFYLGTMTAQDVRAAAAQGGNAAVQRDRRCEAAFYLGEYELMGGNAKAAKPLLEEAARTCTHDFYEYPAAAIELRKLGK